MTLIFWGFEVGFLAAFGTATAKYTGAVIGLAIGNFLKYRLDRAFTFGRNPGAREHAGRGGAGGKGALMELTGWGRFPRFETRAFAPSSLTEAARLQRDLDGVIARGNGRSYGDAAIGAANCLCAGGLDRFRQFDARDGRLSVEAGVLLSDIIAAFLPRGFFPPVVPGTKFVSVGGMIAADIHGKNHHGAGSFGDHVESFDLALPTER